jgi:Spy/CpxP family protein refolding chaperone
MRSLRRRTIASLSALAAALLLWSGVAVTNAALGLGPSASAQGTTGDPGVRKGHRFANMMASIRPPLSGAQKAQISALRKQVRSDYKNQPAPADRATRRARHNALMDKIRGVLTPAQRLDFDAKRQAMRTRPGQH